MKQRTTRFIFSFLLLGAPLLSQAADLSPLQMSSACTEEEVWTSVEKSSVMSEKTMNRFYSALSGHRSMEDVFTDILEFQKQSKLPEQKAFADYWLGRAFLRTGLNHLAYEKFSSLSAQNLPKSALSIQTASLVCLNKIHDIYPSLTPSAKVLKNLSRYSNSESKSAVSQFALEYIKTHLNDSKSALKLLKNAGPYETLALGILSASQGKHSQAVKFLGSLSSPLKKPSLLPVALKKDADFIELLLARSYYAMGDYNKAVLHYDRIPRSSNLITEMLGESSWSYLQSENYKKSLGTAMQLQIGAFKSTFAPDAQVITAMALNELCQYPTSLKSVKKFYSDYQSSREWLVKYSKNPNKHSLYDLSVAYVEGSLDMTAYPEKVAKEWIRSKVFINAQREIRDLFKEKENAQKLFEETPKEFRPVLTAFNKWVDSRQNSLVEKIEDDLHARNRRMLNHLNSSAESLKLVQVEIQAGASHDMIFQNANPDFIPNAKNFQAKKKEKSSPHWNWGNVDPTDDQMEVWEDEIGGFLASLTDKCSSKENYMKEKARQTAANL